MSSTTSLILKELLKRLKHWLNMKERLHQHWHSKCFVYFHNCMQFTASSELWLQIRIKQQRKTSRIFYLEDQSRTIIAGHHFRPFSHHPAAVDGHCQPSCAKWPPLGGAALTNSRRSCLQRQRSTSFALFPCLLHQGWNTWGVKHHLKVGDTNL